MEDTTSRACCPNGAATGAGRGGTPGTGLNGSPPRELSLGDHRAEGQHQLPLVLARHDVKRKVSARLGR
jgi:hypothetical protein